MKKFFLSLAFLSVLFVSCSDDDDARIFLQSNDEVVTITAMIDGEEVNVTSDGSLSPNTLYTGSWELTAEETNDSLEEIAEEDDDHQFFFFPSDGLGVEVEYEDEDDDGTPLGLDFTLTTTDVSTGTLNIQLRHLLNKDFPGILDGDITAEDAAEAGGEVELNVDFPIEIVEAEEVAAE